MIRAQMYRLCRARSGSPQLANRAHVQHAGFGEHQLESLTNNDANLNHISTGHSVSLIKSRFAHVHMM